MKKYALVFIISIFSVSISAQYKPWTSAQQPLKEIEALKKQIVKPNFRKKITSSQILELLETEKPKIRKPLKKLLKNVTQKAEEEWSFLKGYF